MGGRELLGEGEQALRTGESDGVQVKLVLLQTKSWKKIFKQIRNTLNYITLYIHENLLNHSDNCTRFYMCRCCPLLQVVMKHGKRL